MAIFIDKSNLAIPLVPRALSAKIWGNKGLLLSLVLVTLKGIKNEFGEKLTVMTRTKEIAVCSFCTTGANKRVDYTLRSARILNAALYRFFERRNGVSLRSPAIFPLFHGHLTSILHIIMPQDLELKRCRMYL